MKIKYTILSVVVLCASGIGVSFWWPTAMAVPAEDTHAQESQVQDKHGADEKEAGHEEHGPGGQKEKGVTGKDEHEEHAGEEGPVEEVVRLSDAELEEFGITLATAEGGALDQYIDLPGEIVLNADRMAHVVPRVSGIVREVLMTIGDQVKAGELMAVIESRELADGKAAFLAAAEREALAQTNFNREERLWGKKVTSEQEYLDARQALAEARIATNSAEQQLHALGFSDAELKALPGHPDATYTRFEIKAPLAGTIIEKHMTLGENVKDDADVFTIADLSTVWVDINVYQKDLVNIRKGQTVVIEIGHGIATATGTIAWVGPQVDETTRTAKARMELPNPDGDLRPGLFVTARVAVGSTPASIVVPKSALQAFEERTVLFVRTEKGFEPKPVEVGRRNGTKVEILSGLEAGQTYVSQGAFTLKAQLSKGAFGDGHNH
ncbi:MAG: efflux RND transporter periplasmic adaptor subunit [Desulfobulbaceae bacterium]